MNLDTIVMKRSANPFAAYLFATIVTAAIAPGILTAADWPAADWPTAGGNIRRTNVSPDQLELPLTECWRHTPLHPPKPAWPESPAKRDVYRKVYGLSPTVTFDRAFQPVIADRRLHYASSADDAVRCLDAATGQFLWAYATEGPVRLAPTVHNGKLYFGSDDGCVYCLKAQDGQLIWKHRPVQPDRRLPGNGRIISLWPIRSGVLVDSGIAYFTAGLFPSQGAWLYAVDADSGKPVWKQQVDISPQGYLLASTNRLFVPTGRTTPHIYLREDGQQVAAFPGGGQQRAGFPQGGGSYALIVDDVLVHAGGEKRGLEFTTTENREKIITAPGIRLVAHGQTAYILDMDRLKAIHRARYIEFLRLEHKKEKTPDDTQRIAQLRGNEEPAILWDVPCSAPYSMVLAGKHVICGGKGTVIAYDSKTGKQTWQTDVTGKAYTLAVAENRLYAGTDSGTIHCFAQTRGDLAQPTAIPHAHPGTKVPLRTHIAATALESCGTNLGYCLTLGELGLAVADDLCDKTEMNVLCISPDRKAVAEYRQAIAENPTSATDRLTYLEGTLETLQLQEKTFNLIVAAVEPNAKEASSEIDRIARLLRPSGGTALFVTNDLSQTSQIKDRLESATPRLLSEWKTIGSESRTFCVARRGSQQGAGQWTHFYADPGNSACSGDSIQFGPVDIQWFGRPGPRNMVDRHEKNMAPLYKNGRMFVTGDNYIVAVDAYNGTILWQRDLPESIRLGAFKNCGSMAVGDSNLYVASADTCLALDVQTGETAQTFTAPPISNNMQGEWGYVATLDGLLLGSTTKPGANWRIQDIDTQTLIWRDKQPVVTSDALFAVDPKTGKNSWNYRPNSGVIVNPTLAAGAGHVYFVESATPKRSPSPTAASNSTPSSTREPTLVALDLHTGKEAWRTPVDLSSLENVVFMSYADDTLVISGSRNVQDGRRRQAPRPLRPLGLRRPHWQTPLELNPNPRPRPHPPRPSRRTGPALGHRQRHHPQHRLRLPPPHRQNPTKAGNGRKATSAALSPPPHPASSAASSHHACSTSNQETTCL